jgi:hypothetical protein
MTFKDISVGIKTILRDDKLFHVIDSLRAFYPEIQMIIADDGRFPWSPEKARLYEELTKSGHTVLRLTFDAGFGTKSNMIAHALTRPYLLAASDDFDFSDPNAREGIQKLQNTLDTYPGIDITSGRVNNNPYEFILDYKDGVVIERSVLMTQYSGPLPCIVDLTVNYSLIRKDVFKKIRWDDDAKIGQGEHGAFFLDVKRAGFDVAYVPGVNINTLQSPDSLEYRALRARANSPERSCFVKRGIKRYILGNGQVDYDASYSC